MSHNAIELNRWHPRADGEDSDLWLTGREGFKIRGMTWAEHICQALPQQRGAPGTRTRTAQTVPQGRAAQASTRAPPTAASAAASHPPPAIAPWCDAR